MRIAIVGSGVAGLASAYLLARQGHNVTVIERAPKLGPVGAGLLLQPSGQIALQKMGLLDEVIANAEPIEGLHALTHRGQTLVRLLYQKANPALKGYGVHRGDLFSILHRHATTAGATFQLGATITTSRQSESTIEAIDDRGNAHGPFDLLIAADGARSKLRTDSALQAAVREFPLGAAWFSGTCDTVRGRLHQVTRGTRQLIGLLPLGAGRCSLFCALPRNGIEALSNGGLERLKHEIAELCPEAQPLVQQIRNRDDLATARYQIVKLKRWNSRRLVCIGDAAHSTTPHLGQGVNLALLDALEIANAVGNGADLLDSLTRACDQRRKLTMWSWRLSNFLGPVFQHEGWALGAARDRVLPLLPLTPVTGRMMVETMAGLRTGVFRTLPAWSLQ